MNKRRRALLESANNLLGQVEAIVQRVADQESDSMDNMPEGLQSSDQYEKMEQALENLESALEYIGDARKCLEDASE